MLPSKLVMLFVVVGNLLMSETHAILLHLLSLFNDLALKL